MTDLGTIRYSIDADTSGLEQGTDALGEFRQSADEASRSTRDMGSSSQRSGRQVEQSSRQTGNAVQGLTRRLLAAGAAWATYRAAIRETIEVAERYERQELRTQAVLEATGFQAGVTATELRGMADELALATLNSVEGVQQAQQVLLTFGNISSDVFNETISLAADLSTVFGGDLASNSRRLGRLLQDPINNLSSLSRQGITFSDDFEQVIETLQRTGRTAEAQSMILEELSGRMGGAATAEAQGLAGAFDTLSQRVDEFRLGAAESTGVVAGLTSIINSAASGVNRMTEAFFGSSDPARQIEILESELRDVGEVIEQNQARIQRFGEAAAIGARSTIEEYQDVAAAIEADIRALQQQIAEEEQARADASRRAAEARGEAALDGLQREIAAEREATEEKGQLLQEEHESRLNQIEGLIVSEERLEREGFESIQALRQHYATQEVDRYVTAQSELLAEQAAAQNKREQEEREHLQQMQDLRREIEAEMLNDSVALEELRADQLLRQRMNNLDMLREEEMIGRTEHQELVESAEQEHQDRLNEIAWEANQARLQIFNDQFQAYSSLAHNIAGVFDQFAQNRIASERQALRETEDATEEEIRARERVAERAFEDGQRLQSAMAAMNTAAAITNALATGGPGVRWIEAAAVAAEGIRQQAAIQGQSFGGLGVTPSVGGGPAQEMQRREPDVTNIDQQVTINVTGADGNVVDQLRDFFDRDGVLIDGDTSQGRALRNGQ